MSKAFIAAVIQESASLTGAAANRAAGDLMEAIVKELKKSTNVDFEKDTYSEVWDAVTTIVRNHTSAVTPMDVDKRSTS